MLHAETSVWSMLKSFRMPAWCTFSIAVLFLTGFVSRLIPLFDINGRLLQQFPTEDGYLMLTMARNIAIGLGMSTAEGTIETNGTQPFTTFVWSLGYLITGGNKVGGIFFAHIVQMAVSILSAVLLYRLAVRVFKYSSFNREAALIASACFFASPHILPHSMNFLETGFYMLGIICVISFFYEEHAKADTLWSYKHCLLAGLLLGVVFWIRIDSVFIILAACLSYLFRGLPFGLGNIKQRFYRTLVFGSVSVLVASPWLLRNLIKFGSFMPISGPAQSAEYLAQNITIVPSILVEYLFVILPIPLSIQESAPVISVCVVLLLFAAALAVIAYRNADHSRRSIMFMGLVVLACFAGYYGIIFGAKHFVARYLAATAPFLILFSGSCLLFTFEKFGKFARILAIPAVAVSVLIVVGLNARIYSNGIPHQHFQVTGWVAENVPEDTWIGAVQTGTLGYYHDRTINLDGKVNPEALKAKLGEAYCPENMADATNCLTYYIVERELWYIVDWVGINAWINLVPLNEHFELKVNDKQKNLAVLKRHGAPVKSLTTDKI